MAMTSADCIAKKGALYFTAEEKEMDCGGNLYAMPGFWKYAADGQLDAVICGRHAIAFMRRVPKGYLRERLLAIGLFSIYPNTCQGD